MSKDITAIEQSQLKDPESIPEFGVGDTVRVHVQIIEEKGTRTQPFVGVVLAKVKSGIRERFTVRKISSGIGVDRTFFLHSPKIKSIEVIRRGDVRRSKLYYLRGLSTKKARIKERRIDVNKKGAAKK